MKAGEKRRKRSRQEKKGVERKKKKGGKKKEGRERGGRREEDKGGEREPLMKEAKCQSRNKGEWEGQGQDGGNRGIKARKPVRKLWWNPQAASYGCC